jgi:hypothetical protein
LLCFNVVSKLWDLIIDTEIKCVRNLPVNGDYFCRCVCIYIYIYIYIYKNTHTHTYIHTHTHIAYIVVYFRVLPT